MPDAWEVIQAVEPKRNELREHVYMKKQRREKVGLTAGMLSKQR